MTHELLCGCKCVRRTGVMLHACHDHARPKTHSEEEKGRTPAIAAEPPVGGSCENDGVTAGRDRHSDHRTATAAAVVGPESRSLADGLVTLPCPGAEPATCSGDRS